ncbi:MAG: sensor histidine kinase, partial [Candidatus Methanomethylicaceae archaeon]
VVEELKNLGVLDSLSRIEKQIEYINMILSNMQELSKPIKPDLRSVDLRTLIQESTQSVSIPKNIEVDIIDGTGEVELDPYLMKRVLVNIIENAVHAMPRGGRLTIETLKSDSEVCVTIRDTGMGMPKEVMDNLFKPFFTTKAKGTGFGLFNVKRIVEAHGGKISVESEVGKGTTFTIRIPLKR